MKKLLLSFFLLLSITQLNAQDYFPTNQGVKYVNDQFTAFVNATIHVNPTLTIEKGTLLIQNQKVVNTGTEVKIPENCITIDLKGKHIYPSFIDMYTNFGIEKSKNNSSNSRSPQYNASRKGHYWNDHIMTDQRGFKDFKFDSKKAKEFINAGFGVVSTHQQDGIMRGTGMVVSLQPIDGIIDADATQHLSFNKSVTSRQAYPTSNMGAMALLRQTYHDAQWYAGGHSKTTDFALQRLNEIKALPSIFDANSLDYILRANKISQEFNLNYIIKGSGFEYEVIDELKESNARIIVPVNFPKAYDVSDPALADLLNLQDMRQWNQAPANLKILSENYITFAITTSNLKSIKDFKTNLMKAVSYGFDKQKAFESLTTIPAKLLGKSSQIGTLNNKSFANLLITSGEIFNKKTIIYENWVQGHQHIITDMRTIDIRGDYSLNVAGETFKLKISGELEKLKSELKQDTLKIASNISYKNGWVNIFYSPLHKDKTEFVRLTGAITSTDEFEGNGILVNGDTTKWSAKSNTSESKNDPKDKEDEKIPTIQSVTYPNVAFGFKEQPTQQSILFKDVTVWTNEKEGILENTDVLIEKGKIAKIGQNLNASGATILDGSGKHLTSGIIDEHSHIGATSINESGHNSTAEVSIEDMIDADDVNIYRNLSGGVTSIQILHGSANPIGGRSAIIKLKWGQSASDLIYKDTPKFIKFALGENVKQSNWGDRNIIRFPQTRMGVEQVYIDYFQRAKEYNELRKSGQPYRFDIELETLAEILNKERFISCHSYVQSEINMLMEVAEQFNFNINTFTHILEGYKVADKMKAHGVGGSTFSDWWAYKYEVNDAIPFNAAIMHSQGVTVAINSDDAEMSRRLNQEAAKSVKYGGVSEENAWKFVTLNPAKLLHIDDKVGSVKVGKDADLVLWSDHPMSIYAKAEKTIIEGVVYFDIEKNEELNKEISSERNKLINLMLQEKNKGMKTQIPKKKVKELLHCDSL